MGLNLDVLCVGLIVADHVCAPIPKFPPPGTLVTTDSLQLSIGGSAANVSADLAKLGVQVGLVGRVGNDVFGRFVCEELARTGVDCSQVIQSPTTQTAATMVVNIQAEDRRFLHAVGANVELTGTEVNAELLKQAKVLYVGGFTLNPALSAENVAKLFQSARASGVKTVLDVVLTNPVQASQMLAHVLPYTDVFVPNTDEAALITNEKDPVRQAKLFVEAGAETVVVTQGERGATLLNKQGTRLHVPAFNVQQIDGTGGGDAFVAGYIYGLLKGDDLQHCVTYGSALGASCVQSTGATTGVFNAEQLEAFVLQSHMLQSR